MKKLFLLAALAANAQAESQMYAVTESCSSEFKTSNWFFDLDLGARFGRAEPYLQVTPPTNQILTSSTVPGLTSLSGLPGSSKNFSGFVAKVAFGGDYIFKSSCFVLGGYLNYAFSKASTKFPVLHMHNLTAGQISTYTSNFGLKVNGRGYLSFGTRMGVRCNRHLFIAMLGMSFPSFSGSVWSLNNGTFTQKVIQFKAKLTPFLQLGAEYSYSVTRNFAMGLSYLFNMGHIRLSKMKITGTGSNINVGTALQSANAVYRSRRANFSEVMAIFRYMMPTSR